MPSITFTCRALTPFFLQRVRKLSAEDFKKNPEFYISPSIFKGPLRFWWRAMMPYHGQDQISALEQKERSVFGGVSANETTKSSFRMRTKVISFDCQENIHLSKPLRYLFYSALMNERPAVDNMYFKVTFTCNDAEKLDQICCAFWLLANFGGVGSRSRRGAGNFQIVGFEANQYDGPNEISLYSTNSFENHEQPNVVQYLSDTLEQILKKFGNPTKEESPQKLLTFPTPGQTDYCQLAHSNIFFLRAFGTNGQNALKRVGEAFQRLRDEKDPYKETDYKTDSREVLKTEEERHDYFAVRSFLEKGKSKKETVQKATFGLPISYTYRSKPRNNKATITALKSIPNGWKELDRSASSFIIGVTAVNESCFPVVIDFYTKLLPPDYQLAIKGQSDKKATEYLLEEPDGKKREDFINQIDTVDRNNNPILIRIL